MIRKTVLLLFMLRKLLVLNAAAYFSAFADGTMPSQVQPNLEDLYLFYFKGGTEE